MYRQCSANRRAGQLVSSARSSSVLTTRSLATRRSQSCGICCRVIMSGLYAHARNSAGVGSTGFAKPRKDICCRLTVSQSGTSAVGWRQGNGLDGTAEGPACHFFVNCYAALHPEQPDLREFGRELSEVDSTLVGSTDARGSHEHRPPDHEEP